MGVVVVAVVVVSIRTSLFAAKAPPLLSPSGASWWPWSLPGQKMANCSHRTSLFTAKALAPRGGKKKKVVVEGVDGGRGGGGEVIYQCESVAPPGLSWRLVVAERRKVVMTKRKR